jgi:hypothetical protein
MRSRIVAVVVLVGALSAVAATSAPAAQETQPRALWTEQGDTWASLAAECAATTTQMRHANYLATNASLRIGAWIWCPLAPPATTTTTSTTVAPTTTTTTVAPTSTTTTTIEATTTVPSTTTTTVAPTTLPPAPSTDFVETFAGNTGLDRFKVEVYHRNIGQQTLGQAATIWNDEADHGGSWTADHDLACGAPETQRPLSSSRTDFRVDELVYLCRDHVMTTMGDVDGYSIVSFSPDQTFTAATTDRVSWDVNVTDLGGRQWWEVVIVPLSEPHLATIDWMASVAQIASYGPGTIAVANGPTGGNLAVTTQGVTRNPYGWHGICTSVWGSDLEGCAAKHIRRPFTVVDNRDGTISVTFLDQTWTYPGSFPDEFRVYFKDHNYTPDKDDKCPGGVCPGYTWHWDNIAVV